MMMQSSSSGGLIAQGPPNQDMSTIGVSRAHALTPFPAEGGALPA